MEKTLSGAAASAGIGIGKAFIDAPGIASGDISTPGKAKKASPDAENDRLSAAVEALAAELSEKRERLRRTAGEKEAEIMRAHEGLVRDPFAEGECRRLISGGISAEEAVSRFWSEYSETLANAPDKLISERAADARDIMISLLEILGGKRQKKRNAPPGSILVTDEFTPSLAAEVTPGEISGVVARRGAATSHGAILLRSMGIPAVLGVGNADFTDGETLIADGGAGKVIVSPGNDTLGRYRLLQEKIQAEDEELAEYKNIETITRDGVKMHVEVNIASAQEAKTAVSAGGEGVGLFRTEFLFTGRDAPPDEEEQFSAYREAAEALGGRPLTIRTLDVGGDKNVPYFNFEKEENPFLGLRGIRFCLCHPDIFKVQLRAILRAAACGSIRVMLPMITVASEIAEAKSLIAQCCEELSSEGMRHAESVPVGIMIETPAAVLCAPELSRAADFFSIGTNDLTQYITACDRGNPAVAYLYDAGSVPVLRAVRSVCDAARDAEISCHVCGQAAADVRLLPLFARAGVRRFSVPASCILRLKREICNFSLSGTD